MAYLTVLTILLGAFLLGANGLNDSFGAYYSYLWGGDHFSINPQGTEVQLKLDKSSGAGFRSKSDYGSGLFHIRIKIPERKTGGIVTSFYLTSVPNNGQAPGNHFELDYEFLGTTGVLQTNVFDNDLGHREQSFELWFDPSEDFHTYEFLWNSYQIVFFVDDIPIRVFKNNTAQGIMYLDKPMHVEASIWNASSWLGVVNWNNAPFIVHYQDFGFYACLAEGHNALPNNNVSAACDSTEYYWNGQQYRQLNATQQQQMAYYREKYMTYDYCKDPSTRKKECSLNV